MLISILHPIAQRIYETLLIIPMSVVQAIVFGILFLLVVWIVSMSPQLPENVDHGKKSIVYDLRLFALVVIGLQALLYMFF